jgi:hypothetical protein
MYWEMVSVPVPVEVEVKLMEFPTQTTVGEKENAGIGLLDIRIF